MTTGNPARRALVVLSLALALLVIPAGAGHAAAAGPVAGHSAVVPAAAVPAAGPGAAQPSPSPTSPAERKKFAKTRFVLNAGLAAGATYEWIVKPAKAGRFKKGAPGRKLTFVKAALAGAFAYNRLKAAVADAKGDPALSKALAPVTAGIASLKALPAKLRNGEDVNSIVDDYDKTITKVKDAGKSAGADVKNKVPSLSDLKSGANNPG
ncbi:hypothetical protein [Streptomyces sp. HPF1205]|uniref:hypothetical protein n=1 Tax=Streptomyces sp. HPF1205 TaxID=2873262 RepID=UPI001CED313B|nr:hypothetical protein [Streptomyces sp. HPF1205]